MNKKRINKKLNRIVSVILLIVNTLSLLPAQEITRAFNESKNRLDYYVEKAFKLDDFGNRINDRTHFLTTTLFGYYDPDKGTSNRWWMDKNAHVSVYRKATPKSSRISK